MNRLNIHPSTRLIRERVIVVGCTGMGGRVHDVRVSMRTNRTPALCLGYMREDELGLVR
jgi:hypothetical protein